MFYSAMDLHVQISDGSIWMNNLTISVKLVSVTFEDVIKTFLTYIESFYYVIFMLHHVRNWFIEVKWKLCAKNEQPFAK
jgi:hypothetical protein